MHLCEHVPCACLVHTVARLRVDGRGRCESDRRSIQLSNQRQQRCAGQQNEHAKETGRALQATHLGLKRGLELHQLLRVVARHLCSEGSGDVARLSATRDVLF